MSADFSFYVLNVVFGVQNLNILVKSNISVFFSFIDHDFNFDSKASLLNPNVMD